MINDNTICENGTNISSTKHIDNTNNTNDQ